jgi:hypothetical protein
MAGLATLLGGRPATDEPAPSQPVCEHERQKPTRRKPLPEHLPFVDVEVLPDNEQRVRPDPTAVVNPKL